jgi:class I fructose-bisphosphate aldolase
MKVTSTTKKIISHYIHENVGVRSNLMKMLGQGKLGGTGRMIILPVDQGFEHGPDRSFAVNSPAYDPNYHHQLAIDAGLSAYAAPLGLLQTSSDSFYGQIPTILKINSSNTLANSLDQAVTGSIDDALKLGCAAIGFTIYPGSDHNFELMEEYRSLSHEAKSKGLAVVLWAYARGANISKKGETAMNIISYAAHMSALLGANIIKVKLPSDFLEEDPTQAAFEKIKLQSEPLLKELLRLQKLPVKVKDWWYFQAVMPKTISLCLMK